MANGNGRNGNGQIKAYKEQLAKQEMMLPEERRLEQERKARKRNGNGEKRRKMISGFEQQKTALVREREQRRR